MPRQFNKIDVTFERNITQQQTVSVPTPPGLNEQTAQSYAEELAEGRLKERGWNTVDEVAPAIVNGIPAHAGEIA